MSRFSKLSHVLWHCQYHIVWVPKYRYRVLKDRVAFEVSKGIRVYTERLGCEVIELNVQVFRQFTYLKQKPYWGNHFWAKGYCVDTVGVDAEMIHRYVKHQEKIERNLELKL